MIMLLFHFLQKYLRYHWAISKARLMFLLQHIMRQFQILYLDNIISYLGFFLLISCFHPYTIYVPFYISASGV